MKRLNRIFKEDGRTVIVAMDHGMSLSVNPAMDKTGDILKKVIAGGADALLLTYGIATKYADILQDVGVILRVDGGCTALSGSGNNSNLLFDIKDALRIGADAVVCMGFPGTPFESEYFKNIANLSKQGRKWGVPVMAEMLPGGFSDSIAKTPENIAMSARLGCEYGANIIKTTYAGTPEEFRSVIDASYQPVVILGGEKVSGLDSMFTCIENAVSVGAAGVAIGRNVWNHEHPDKVVEALVDLVHNGKRATDIKGL